MVGYETIEAARREARDHVELMRQRDVGLKRRSAEKEKEEALEALHEASQNLHAREEALERLVCESVEKDQTINDLLDRVVKAEAALEAVESPLKEGEIVKSSTACQTDGTIQEETVVAVSTQSCQTDGNLMTNQSVACQTTNDKMTEVSQISLYRWLVLGLLSLTLIMSQTLRVTHYRLNTAATTATNRTSTTSVTWSSPWQGRYVDLDRLVPGGQVGRHFHGKPGMRVKVSF